MERVYYVLRTTSLNKNKFNLFFKDLNKLITNENVTSQVIILPVSTKCNPQVT
jgi:hypothetical protein